MNRSRSYTPALTLVATLFVAACGVPVETETETELQGLERLLELGPGLVEDPAVRRDALVESLVDPSNGYSRLRLAGYGLGSRGWDVLPERNFPVRPTTVSDIGRFVDDPFATSSGAFEPVFDRESFRWDHDTLIELGRRAFHEYPLSFDAALSAAFVDEASAEEAGLWRHEDRLGGMVRARLPDGREVFAATCASCHASVEDGALVDGRTNARIDRDRIARMARGIPGTTWGPGAVDVTPDGVTNPTAITDLRPLQHQRRLHWAATLHNSPEALAVRVETLMITSANEQMRPPREVSVALAYYLWSLGEDVRVPDDELPGARLFAQHCSTCHGADGTAAEPVALSVIGTDPLVGESTMRGTGYYRVPSLYRVGSRTQFLHEGKVESLEQLLDPARLTEIPGHVHGTGLSGSDREQLIEYLETL